MTKKSKSNVLPETHGPQGGTNLRFLRQITAYIARPWNIQG